MKKNIISVIIIALTVINVVLTAIMFFVMLPTFQKTNTLITQVCSVLNIELDADEDADPNADVSMADKQPIAVSFESAQTYNLQVDTAGDNKEHYAMLNGYTLYLNKNSDDFDDINEALTADTAQISGAIASVIQSHTYSEATQDLIQKEALEEIQKILDSKVAVQLVLDGFVKQ